MADLLEVLTRYGFHMYVVCPRVIQYLYATWFVEQSFMISIVFGVSNGQMCLEGESGLTQKGMAFVQFEVLSLNLF